MSADSVWSVFEETVAQFPGKEAILHGESSCTFSEWRERAMRYASAADASGVGAGDRVLLWMNGSVESAAALLGIWAAGAVAVIMDANEPVSHFTHAVETVEPALIFIDDELALPAETAVPVRRPSDVTREVTVEPRPADASAPASIVFTSGSTGMPKGVTQPHRNLVSACRAVGGVFGYTPEDRIVCTVPWSFDYGYGQLLTTAMLGVTQIIPERLDPFMICAAIESHRPTVLPVIPSIITYLLQGLSPFAQTDLSSIRMVTNTGGAIPVPVLERAMEVMPGASFYLNFGMTETYRTSCLGPEHVRAKPTSMGGAIPGVELALVREDGTVIDGADEVGQLVHRGAYIFEGYWNDAASTARALRPDPLAPVGHPDPPLAVFTGDLARRDADGHYYHVGRMDHQIKSMGVRVSPGEIESVLHRSGFVKEVGVFGMPHEMLGHEIWAAVAPSGPLDPETDITVALTKYARERMSRYMIPRRFLVLEGPLPKTRTGKTDYKALKRMAEAEIG